MSVFQKPNGAQGRKMHRKPTPTNLSLSTLSCHHLAQKCGVLATLIQRAWMIVYRDSSTGELQYFRRVFKKNRLFPMAYTAPLYWENSEPVSSSPYLRPVSQYESFCTLYKRLSSPMHSKCLLVLCSCDRSYTAEKGHTVEECCLEHARHIKLGQLINPGWLSTV